MEFSRSLRYPVDIEALIAVLTNTDFIQSRFEEYGAKAEVEAFAPDANRQQLIRTHIVLPSMLVPSSIRGFLPPELKISFNETFINQQDGTWKIDTDIKIASLPVSAKATSTLSPEGAETVREISGDLRVKIPFFGKKAEAGAIEYADLLFEMERKAVTRWLAH